ncbi:hypothetical protein RJ639_019772 [Escallonia herrerae]|uniref:Uncharacterized protein n=1 Tax=Escallonia herrerae TaxID=1293975 RepID=A0AA88V822_9ASTE|nr:hypothetical protein RJ639_019772 [Escallonia herrerae]
MKLKMNKACDLSSISVFPPHARFSSSNLPLKASALPSGTEPSIFNSSNRSQASQLRSQQSQQSLSQSQHGMFSQFSQNSLDDVVVNDQVISLSLSASTVHVEYRCVLEMMNIERFSSQERENSSKMISCLPPSNYTREDSQMQISRSSTNLMRQWKPAVLDQRCQTSEELGHKIGVIETSLSRFGKILDSVQSDIMQVNKGTKEVALEMESIRQKLIVHDNSLQLTVTIPCPVSMLPLLKCLFVSDRDEYWFYNTKKYADQNKGQEDIKASFEGGLKSISDQLNQNICQDSLQKISSLLSGLPEKIEAYILKLQNDLCKTLTREIQACITLKLIAAEHWQV